jgi:hypothetical protein
MDNNNNIDEPKKKESSGTTRSIKNIFDSLNAFVNGQVVDVQVVEGQVVEGQVDSEDNQTFLHKIVTRIFNSVESFMNGPHGQMIILNGIFLYSRVVTYVSQQFNKLCESNRLVNTLAGSIGRIVGFVSNLVSNHSHEPEIADWLNESYVVLAGTEGTKGTEGQGPIEYSYDETYTMLENCILLDPAIIEHPICKKMVNMYQSAVTNIILSPSKSEGLVILKYIDNYIFRKVGRSVLTFPRISKPITVDSIQFKQSRVKFLGVTYSHPKMTNKIDIEIPKSMCMVDNEILSPAFILRCLKYQPQSYVFDMNYEINIIDGNINSYKIKSHQYVVLGERDIQIIE